MHGGRESLAACHLLTLHFLLGLLLNLIFDLLFDLSFGIGHGTLDLGFHFVLDSRHFPPNGSLGFILGGADGVVQLSKDSLFCGPGLDLGPSHQDWRDSANTTGEGSPITCRHNVHQHSMKKCI